MVLREGRISHDMQSAPIIRTDVFSRSGGFTEKKSHEDGDDGRYSTGILKLPDGASTERFRRRMTCIDSCT